MRRTIISFQRHNCRSRSMAQGHTARLGISIRNVVQIFREFLVASRCLGRIQKNQSIVSCLSDRGVNRGMIMHSGNARKASITSLDRVYCVEYRNVNYGHRPALPAGAELLPENPWVSWWNRRMVECTAAVRNLIPMNETP